jgi:hypothetical protein
MLRKRIIQVGLLPILALPLMGESCTEEKLVSLSIGVDTTAEFLAEGSQNWHDDTDQIDFKNEVDIAAALDDADVDPNDVESIKVSRIYYRITVPDPVSTRMIEDGDVSVERINVGTHPIITNFSGPAGAVTDWIEVTHLVNADGIEMVNDFMVECLAELQGGPPVGDGIFEYHVDGISTPADISTGFQWEIKVSFSVVANETFDVPSL